MYARLDEYVLYDVFRLDEYVNPILQMMDGNNFLLKSATATVEWHDILAFEQNEYVTWAKIQSRFRVNGLPCSLQSLKE